MSVATAAVLSGTVCDGIAARVPDARQLDISVEHPSGEFTLQLTLVEPCETSETGEEHRERDVESAALVRTARWLFDGVVGIPASLATSIERAKVPGALDVTHRPARVSVSIAS